MFKVLVLVSLCLSASAFACPQLGGMWMCNDNSSPQPTPQVMMIMQQTINGADTINISGNGSPMTLITDGQDHQQPDPANNAVGTLNAKCDATSVSATLKAHSPQGDFAGDFNFLLIDQKDLMITAHIATSGITLKCVRN